MCGRYASQLEFEFTFDQRSLLEKMNPLIVDQLVSREPRYNICPTQLAPVIAHGEDGFELKALRWGLVPSWSKDMKSAGRGINARAETVAKLPTFRAAFKSRRALIPATGYFEWQGDPGSKQPYYFYPKDRSLLMFAGLWEAWKDKADPQAEWQKTFTIITNGAGLVSSNVHDREPAILPCSMWEQWLTGTRNQASDLLLSLPEADLAYYAVSKAVSNPKNQGEDLVEPISIE
ncbi:putative SOS response-associated peptidase YedK [Rhodanobacter sp. K2T2]|uniref:SOS response-associated peptidase n=1 Tax=Rhodanobacter sp. K2T2 TaxID=2723085 RepID=UPI0015C6D7D4|nr:SOS response-associated peptidase [Rhodanobacter sp. K2T2]NYE30059.1 putative SOS response-associated peptidase YedK [Rhodanobacter sp. K2T2]